MYMRSCGGMPNPQLSACMLKASACRASRSSRLLWKGCRPCRPGRQVSAGRGSRRCRRRTTRPGTSLGAAPSKDPPREAAPHPHPSPAPPVAQQPPARCRRAVGRRCRLRLHPPAVRHPQGVSFCRWRAARVQHASAATSPLCHKQAAAGAPSSRPPVRCSLVPAPSAGLGSCRVPWPRLAPAAEAIAQRTLSDGASRQAPAHPARQLQPPGASHWQAPEPPWPHLVGSPHRRHRPRFQARWRGRGPRGAPQAAAWRQAACGGCTAERLHGCSKISNTKRSFLG